MKKFLVFLLFMSTPALAAEKLTLNDIPAVIDTLRGCTRTPSFLVGVTITCQNRKPWVAITPDGLLVFYKNDRGLDITGNGVTLDQALQDLAAKANANHADAEDLIKSIGELLATQ